MRLSVLGLASAAIVTVLPGAAWPHGNQVPCNPYMIVQTCDANGDNCRARLTYAKGHSLAASPTSSYFYRKPHRWLYHQDFGHEHKVALSRDGTRETITYKRKCVPHHHDDEG
jgi:hypothetical protein